MVSFVILLIARTARIVCADRHTDIQTDRHTHETTTVTLAAHACRGLIIIIIMIIIIMIIIIIIINYNDNNNNYYIKYCK